MVLLSKSTKSSISSNNSLTLIDAIEPVSLAYNKTMIAAIKFMEKPNLD